MKCDYCDKKATVFLTQLAEGQMKKVCLCNRCAEERGVTDPTGFSLADMLLGGVQQDFSKTSEEKQPSGKRGGKKCPQCGFSLDDFQKVRRLGCGNCYAVFAEELGQVLGGMHKGMKHQGKVPVSLMESHYRNEKLGELRTKLGEAIAAESYEDAARLRDEIQVIEKREVSK